MLVEVIFVSGHGVSCYINLVGRLSTQSGRSVLAGTLSVWVAAPLYPKTTVRKKCPIQRC